MLALFFTVLMRSRGFYEARNLLLLERQAKAATLAWFASFGLVITFAFLLKTSADLSRGAALMIGATGLVAVISQRLLWRPGLALALARGAIGQRKAVVLSMDEWAAASTQASSLRYAGIDAAQQISLPRLEATRREVLAELVASTRQSEIDEVIIVLSAGGLNALDGILEALRPLPLPVRLMPDARLSHLVRQPSRQAGKFALIDLSREPLSAGELGLKRTMDVAVAGVTLLAAAPLLIVAMAAIRIDSSGPVLFRQRRRGFSGRTFSILKLRTMTVLEDGEAVSQARRGDRRVTRVGAWLRRTSIDELPQLWNVLRGDMSVVGPRPHAVAHDNYYDTLIENYAFRHHVKPGLTGWAQVNGHRGETPEVAMMAARVDHDIWYVNNWSFLLDLRILFLTTSRLLAPAAY